MGEKKDRAKQKNNNKTITKLNKNQYCFILYIYFFKKMIYHPPKKKRINIKFWLCYAYKNSLIL